MKRATVGIGTMLGSGSGVIVSPDGWVLTAAHVVGTAKTVDVVLADGSSTQGRVVRTAPDADAALVKVATRLPCASLRERAPESGEDAIVVGSPLGETLSQSVTKGIVSARRESGGIRLLQVDAAVNPGNSGGPVFDGDGALLGIVSFKAAFAEGLGFAIEAPDVLSQLDVQLGDATGEVEERRIEGTVGGLQGVEVSIQTPSEKQTGKAVDPVKACAVFEIQEDPIDGRTTYERLIPDLYEMRFTGGDTVSFATFYDLHSFGVLSDMATHIQARVQSTGKVGSATVVFLLENGTRIEVAGAPLVAQTTSVDQGRFVVEMQLAEDVLAHFARSAVTHAQWTVADRRFTVDLQAKGYRHYQVPFTCMLTQVRGIDAAALAEEQAEREALEKEKQKFEERLARNREVYAEEYVDPEPAEMRPFEGMQAFVLSRGQDRRPGATLSSTESRPVCIDGTDLVVGKRREALADFVAFYVLFDRETDGVAGSIYGELQDGSRWKIARRTSRGAGQLLGVAEALQGYL